jgi:hypothetical protein
MPSRSAARPADALSPPATTAARGAPAPSPARVLRRALIGWGLGHVLLGERRGWLLLLLEVVSVVAIGLLAAALIDGTRWLVVFPPLVAFLVVWIGQALDAYRRAVRAGGEPGGELAMAAVLPVALAALTAFWLVGGRHGSPTATLQGYIEAWIADRPDVAVTFFAEQPDEATMRSQWAIERADLTASVGRARVRYGPESGLDPEHPFDSLRVRQGATSAGRAAMNIEIVRSQRVETTLLGIIPTAAQETVPADEPGLVIMLDLVRDAPPAWWPLPPLDSYVWKISSIVPLTRRLN